MGKFGEAVSLLLRFAVACQGLQLRSSLCKCYLGAVVVWLYAEAAAQAWAVYQVCGAELPAPWQIGPEPMTDHDALWGAGCHGGGAVCVQ